MLFLSNFINDPPPLPKPTYLLVSKRLFSISSIFRGGMRSTFGSAFFSIRAIISDYIYLGIFFLSALNPCLPVRLVSIASINIA